MKKYLIGIVTLCTLLTSCGNRTSVVLNTIDYEVIEVCNSPRNGFGTVLGLDVIVRMDSTLYFGWTDTDTTLIRIYSKLNNIKRK